MPITVFPNQSGTAGLAPRAPRPYVRGRRPAAATTGGVFHDRKQSVVPSFPMYPVRQPIAEDIYHISMSGDTLLRSTFTPTDTRRCVYDVTTDVASHNSATTILWSFDPAVKKVTELARITWSLNGKTLVEMGGVRVPATEFLTKPKWKLGMSSYVLSLVYIASF